MDNALHTLNDKHLTTLLSIIDIGTWDWDTTNNKVVYSTAWARILGYTKEELPPSVDTWERMVLPEDLAYANEQIENHLSGKTPIYEAEFRMCCKDGSIIWAQDKGKVTEYDADGKPLRFVGVLQDISRLKDVELRLRENQESLDLAVSVAGLGTWDWDIVNNSIKYNDEYLEMLDYTQSDMDGSIEEWESLNHPEDLPGASKMLDAYIAGEIPVYEYEVRMKHKDGSYIWTRDVGRIVARDAEGNATRLIGGHLNIDALKCSEKELKEAFKALEQNKHDLESTVESRTKEVVEQDKMLWTVNQISRKLLAFNPRDDFDVLVQDCLRLLGESINENRVYIWKDRIDEHGEVYCTPIYEWVRGVVPIQGNQDCEEISYRHLPAFLKATDSNQCLNDHIKNLSENEKRILMPQGIKTILIAPVSINGKRWGFIGVDNCENEMLFSSIEENMLFMSGSMLGNTIEKMETEAKMREMEQRTQLMLNATPLCCNLWSKDFKNMSCNDEAVRLFELSSQKEYLERFNELSPEYQPCGGHSGELSAEYIKKAFEEGYYRFAWQHQKLDGTPISTEVTLVRIRYKEDFIVAGYTRDLREIEATLAKLQLKEDDLRNSRDEALLNSKAKSNFLANMSHEIRTPMNAISGLAEIILRESQGGKSAEYAKGIKNACSNLLNIINDILDISKIESGKLEIINAKYEFSSLLNDVITISQMRLGRKPLMFITDIDSNLPAWLIGDEIRIKQILINVLSNAIKFTQEGHIALRVSGTLEGNKAILKFEIKDTGMGIKDEDLKRLFVEFERVNTTKNRNIEGTGLGLAISKQLCDMMGGNIDVKSIYGEGTVFTATIPQECQKYQRLSEVQGQKVVLLYEPRELYRKSIEETIENLGCECVSCANQSELYDNIRLTPYDFVLTSSLHLQKVQHLVEKYKLAVLVAVFADYGESVKGDCAYTIVFPVNCLQMANMLNGLKEDAQYSKYDATNTHFIAPTARILVVDDNPVNLSVAAGLMEPYQFTIDTAVNGLEAVAKVQENFYDLVFMDHMMPEMDGIDATVAIRKLKGDYFASLPIIALTANALVGTQEMFIREGMNDFLAKPIEINKLGHLLIKWLPKTKITKQKPEDLKAPEDTKAPMIEKEIFTIEGINTIQGILSVGGSKENYLQILSVYYTDGNQKCVSLLQHFTKKDILTFKIEVHALKSASATIGAMELARLAAKLETAAQNEDIFYIDGNIDTLLTTYKKILEGIRPVIDSHANLLKGTARTENLKEGDLESLKIVLEDLHQATEFANIAKIEEIMEMLQGFSWPEVIQKELAEMVEYLSMFDYDAVLEAVVRLKEA